MQGKRLTRILSDADNRSGLHHSWSDRWVGLAPSTIVLGLSRLGHDVYFFEDSDDYPSCYNPTTNSMQVDPSYGLGFGSRTFNAIGLSEKWTYYDAHTQSWSGPAADRAIEICTTADLLLNISG